MRTDGRTDGRTDRQTDRQTYMTKPIVAFRNFAKGPKNCDVTDSLPQRLVNALQFYEQRANDEDGSCGSACVAAIWTGPDSSSGHVTDFPD
jgi:hypothetical protein